MSCLISANSRSARLSALTGDDAMATPATAAKIGRAPQSLMINLLKCLQETRWRAKAKRRSFRVDDCFSTNQNFGSRYSGFEKFLVSNDAPRACDPSAT